MSDHMMCSTKLQDGNKLHRWSLISCAHIRHAHHTNNSSQYWNWPRSTSMDTLSDVHYTYHLYITMTHWHYYEHPNPFDKFNNWYASCFLQLNNQSPFIHCNTHCNNHNVPHHFTLHLPNIKTCLFPHVILISLIVTRYQLICTTTSNANSATEQVTLNEPSLCN
jgi:hypothetical protein